MVKITWIPNRSQIHSKLKLSNNHRISVSTLKILIIIIISAALLYGEDTETPARTNQYDKQSFGIYPYRTVIIISTAGHVSTDEPVAELALALGEVFAIALPIPQEREPNISLIPTLSYHLQFPADHLHSISGGCAVEWDNRYGIFTLNNSYLYTLKSSVKSYRLSVKASLIGVLGVELNWTHNSSEERFGLGVCFDIIRYWQMRTFSFI